MILGRGSFTESFPLFGFDLADYERLFEEKLELFAALLAEQPVTWLGETRAPLADQEVFPKSQSGLRTWVGVGGSPESVVRAARYGLPLMLAIIGGDPQRFQPYVDLYPRAGAVGPISSAPRCPFPRVRSPIGPRGDGAALALLQGGPRPHWRRAGGWPPVTRAGFEQEVSEGSLYVGSPDTIAEDCSHRLTVER